MEAASLTLAHSHARNASAETQKANTAVAREEHEHAAGEFSNASKSTQDTEALRILKLLEDHHLHLAHIIEQQSLHRDTLTTYDQDISPRSDTAGAAPSALANREEQTLETNPTKAGSPATPTGSPPVPHWRKATRDVPTSIASNLATARGIPSTQTRRGAPISPTLSAQTARGKIVAQQQQHTRAGSPEASSVPRQPRSKADATTATSRPSTTLVDAPVLSARSLGARSDEPFTRFFNTFETVFSALSAPLAFAGLPLGNEGSSAPSTEPSEKQQAQSHTQSPQSPELSRLFSKAALRALREDHASFAPSESFYVVPSTGHTVTYANILSRSNHQHHKSTASSSGDIDDGEYFVDASETPQPPSPTATRPTSSRRPVTGAKRGKTGKTLEELELENDTMRTILDAQSRRLHLWELSSQSQSQALQASLRAQNHAPGSATAKTMLAGARGPSDLSTASSSGPSSQPTSAPAADSTAKPDTDSGTATQTKDDETAKRLTELEALLATADEERQRVEKESQKLKRENEKLQGVVSRYRERWRELVNGARKRRDDRVGSVTAVGDASVVEGAESKDGEEHQEMS